MKEIELRNVKGCTDYSPREQFIRNYISDTLKKVFKVICLKYNKKCPDIKIIRDWRNIENLISDVKRK